MTIYPVPKPVVRPRRAQKVKARTRIKRVNKSREGRAFRGTRDNAFMAWLHTMPCAICTALQVRQTRPTEVEHFVLRSHGGKDRGDCYPTCGNHRELRHGVYGPRAFTKMLQARGFDERKLCNKLATMYAAECWPCP